MTGEASSADLWKRISGDALVGTAHRATEALSAPGALGELLASLPEGAPEERLLASAAAVDLWRVAGRPAARPEIAQMPACPAETQPVIARGAAARLEHLLEGDLAQLLPEWLGAVAGAGKIVPPRRLPALLEAGRASRALRGAILAVIGHRGRWLAAQNDEWAYAAGAADESKIWDEGSVLDRVRWIAEERGRDAEGARKRLEDSWKQEPVDARKGFAETLGAGLSLADEPFLESLLADRSKEVRETASRWLSLLPESAFSKRMVARAAPLLRVERKLLKKTLAAEPPESLDDQAARDGIQDFDEKKTKRAMGKRGHWLRQILARTPLDGWERELGLAPADLVAQAAKTDWASALIEGWGEASALQRSEAWIAALLEAGAEEGERDAELIGALPPPAREKALLGLIERQPKRLPEWVGAAPSPWSRALSAAIFDALFAQLKPAKSYDYRLGPALMEAATLADPAVLAQVEAGARPFIESEDAWASTASKCVDRLRFRQEMLKEIEA